MTSIIEPTLPHDPLVDLGDIDYRTAGLVRLLQTR